MDDDVLGNKNIAKPALNLSGKRCFRVVGDYQHFAGESSGCPRKFERLEFKEGMCEEQLADEYADAENEYNIEERKEGFLASLPVPSVIYGHIIGKKGQTKTNIERSTNTRVRFPSKGTSGNVVVLGQQKGGVHRACDQIMRLVSKARSQTSPTHFVCVPCTHSSILDTFRQFKETIIGYPGIHEKLLQRPMKLHVTLGILVLLEDSDIAKASQIIEEFVMTEVREITNNESITCQLKGVNHWKDDPTTCNLIFACVEEGNSVLTDIGTKLQAKLSAEGLGPKQCGTTKLHCTLLNSKWCRKSDDAKKSKSVRDNSFDGTQILETHKNHDFGSISVDRIRLSAIRTLGEDGSHRCVAEYTFANK